MTVLPTDPGVVFIGCLLRDPDEGPWGSGATDHGPPPAPRSCATCGGGGWINDVFYGATLGVRCPACGGT
jgi:hypothetical protein